jgi:hypothetical protein
MNRLIVGVVLLASLGGVGCLFWSQELKYALPTPVPANFHARAVAETIDLRELARFDKGRAVFLHFFNPDCPCSRFNIKHFKNLVAEYGDHVQVYAVIPAYADLDRARDMIELSQVTVLQDRADSLAAACGVYSTPQAVVIDAHQKLFYRGNYNKSRYCTTKESNYAEIALQALVSGAAPPQFNVLATQSYGCELPKDSTTHNFLINLLSP